MQRKILSCSQKALAINLDPRFYGSFAEIGAGQEVVRHFFQVGGAAGTVAKSGSAYDMEMSDQIYKKVEGGRYVSEARLLNMLNIEHGFLKDTLWESRSANTVLFAFANTVATKSFSRPDKQGHGWLGIRMQRKSESVPTDIIVHVHLIDDDYLMQQELIGLIGVNLIYGAFYYFDQPDVFIESLVDNIALKRVEIDLVECFGPASEHIDNRLLSLHIVKSGLSKAILFDENGSVEHAAEIIYKKPVLIQRGSFRPVTLVNMDMLNCALKHFQTEPAVKDKEHILLTEITLSNLASQGNIEERDFLDRINLLTALGYRVLITNFQYHYEFAKYMARSSKSFFALVLGVDNLRETLEEKHYQHLDGGILEAFGKLFSGGGKLYIYPRYDENSNTLLTAANLKVADNIQHLYQYLLDNKYIVDLDNCDVSKLNIISKQVLEMIQNHDAGWEQYLPDTVAAIIKEKRLWQ